MILGRKANCLKKVEPDPPPARKSVPRQKWGKRFGGHRSILSGRPKGKKNDRFVCKTLRVLRGKEEVGIQLVAPSVVNRDFAGERGKLRSGIEGGGGGGRGPQMGNTHIILYRWVRKKGEDCRYFAIVKSRQAKKEKEGRLIEGKRKLRLWQ